MSKVDFSPKYYELGINARELRQLNFFELIFKMMSARGRIVGRGCRMTSSASSINHSSGFKLIGSRLIIKTIPPLNNNNNSLHLRTMSSSSSSQVKGTDSKYFNLEEEPEPEGTSPYTVYEGLLTRQLKHIKIFSMTTSLGGLWMQPIIIQNASTHGKAATIAMLSMIGFFTYVTPFLIHLMAKKYVTEIIYDPNTQLYTAITYNFFLMKKQLQFHKDDVIIPDAPGPFTSVLVKSKEGAKIPIFFTLESFKYPNHYGLIMGYDKPLELHMKPEDIVEAVEKQRTTKSQKSKG